MSNNVIIQKQTLLGFWYVFSDEIVFSFPLKDFITAY